VIRVDSLDDPRVAIYRSLADPAALTAAGVFVAEGRLVVRRLIASTRFVTRSVLVTGAAHAAMRDVLAASPGVPIYVVDQDLMNGIAGFNIHRGCLAIGERPAPRTIEDLAAGRSSPVAGRASLDAMRRVVVLEGVNNPDNVGGIFRSAAAFGTEAIVLGPSCGDPLYRKAVRTSMAATLTVPFVDAGEWPAALQMLRAHGLRVLALTPREDAPPIDAFPRDLARVAVLVGAEGEGLSEAALNAADARVRIPMRCDRADSLNATVAASIALFHFA
jgi:tRNA G18 (ribose-2'-O)-methylase SpoU